MNTYSLAYRSSDHQRRSLKLSRIRQSSQSHASRNSSKDFQPEGLKEHKILRWQYLPQNQYMGSFHLRIAPCMCRSNLRKRQEHLQFSSPMYRQLL